MRRPSLAEASKLPSLFHRMLRYSPLLPCNDLINTPSSFQNWIIDSISSGPLSPVAKNSPEGCHLTVSNPAISFLCFICGNCLPLVSNNHISVPTAAMIFLEGCQCRSEEHTS